MLVEDAGQGEGIITVDGFLQEVEHRGRLWAIVAGGLR